MWDGESWTVIADRRFVYDGWTPILELDGSNGNAIVRKLTWGLDLAALQGGSVNSLQGAGGIGGLLAVVEIDNLVVGGGGGDGRRLLVLESGGETALLESQSAGPTTQPGSTTQPAVLNFADAEGAAAELSLDDPAGPLGATLQYQSAGGSTAVLELVDVTQTADQTQLLLTDAAGNAAMALLPNNVTQGGGQAAAGGGEGGGGEPLEAVYWYFYDGNGNVGQVFGTTPFAVVAHYEYDPYGNLLRRTGDYADINPWRFSTKWYDAEQDVSGDPDGQDEGLYYYGYRYYSPKLGRWVSRDPMGEGTLTLAYGFVDNAPIGGVDYLGLFGAANHRKVTLMAFARPFARCNPSPAALQAVADSNVRTDYWALFLPAYHAQNMGFVDHMRDRMSILLNTDCCSGTELDILTSYLGPALHMLQDFCSHTDWIEGGSPEMMALYDAKGDYCMSCFAANHTTHGESHTLNMNDVWRRNYAAMDVV